MTDSQTPTETAPGDRRRARTIRWWPVLVIFLAAVVAVVWVRLATELNHQERNMRTAIVGIFTALALLLWSLFLSRLRWRIRLGILACAVGGILAVAALFHIRGVTGDLLPVVEWRWKSGAAPTAALTPATGVVSPAAPTSRPVLASAEDYPQFLGPHRNATVTGVRLARDWTTQAPVLIWRQPIGTAWSGFAVAGNFAVTQEQGGEAERVTCYDLATGKLLWSHADPAHYHTTIAGEGPRATPTIAGERVYTLGATGILNCLDLATGKALWTKNIIADNQSHVNEWGTSCSPLVLDNLVVVSAGGHAGRSLVAYEKGTGTFVWGGGTDGAGYSSPCLATIAGVRQILIFNSGSITAHDPKTGTVLWDHPWPRGQPHVALPVVLPGDRVFVSSGYGTGSELLQIQRDTAGKMSATRLWKSIRLKAKFTNVVYRKGYIYGLDDGILVCLDAATGELKWKGGRYGHGQVLLLDDVLLVSTEQGEVVMLEPVPEAPRELTRFTVFQAKTWNPPALAGAYLLMRNDLEAACYRLPIELASAAPAPGNQRPQ